MTPTPREKLDPRSVIGALSTAASGFAPTSIDAVAAEVARDPFRILVSTVISLRTKDEVTIAASRRLFAKAATPAALLRLRASEIERLIYPAGFYRTKARALREISARLIEVHGGEVPADEAALLALPGVGRKTANLVLGLAFGVPAICVDTHVHRISNRLGWVTTKSPAATEAALAALVPRDLWIPLNGLFVAFGKAMCTPISPRCGACPLSAACPKRGVGGFR